MASGSSNARLKIGIAVGIFVVAGAVFAYQLTRSGDPKVDATVEQKARDMEQSIKQAESRNPQAPEAAPEPPRTSRRSAGPAAK